VEPSFTGTKLHSNEAVRQQRFAETEDEIVGVGAFGCSVTDEFGRAFGASGNAKTSKEGIENEEVDQWAFSVRNAGTEAFVEVHGSSLPDVRVRFNE